MGKRKPVAILGYSLGAVTKPFFALATSVEPIIAARLLDRVGKGLEAAPAMHSLPTSPPPHLRVKPSACANPWTPRAHLSGLSWPPVHAALGQQHPGGFSGWRFCLLSCAALFIWGEPERPAGAATVNPIRRETLFVWMRASGLWWPWAAFSRWQRFSGGLLVLRAQDGGVPMAWIPLVLMAMNQIYAAGAYRWESWPTRWTIGSCSQLVWCC